MRILSMLMDMDIGNLLDRRMREAGIRSQSELARISGVSQSTINRILKGAADQGVDALTIFKLAKACRCTMESLMSDEGSNQVSSDGQKIDPLKTKKFNLVWADSDEERLLTLLRHCKSAKSRAMIFIAAETAVQAEAEED